MIKSQYTYKVKFVGDNIISDEIDVYSIMNSPYIAFLHPNIGYLNVQNNLFEDNTKVNFHNTNCNFISRTKQWNKTEYISITDTNGKIYWLFYNQEGFYIHSDQNHSLFKVRQLNLYEKQKKIL